MATRAGNWRGRMQLTHDPENKLLGILGMGGIGTAVAKRAVAFGLSIQYHNRREVSKEKNAVGARYVSFEELLRTSDVISVHLPLNEGTRGMIGMKEFGMMKDRVVIVNTARGPIVDESALVDALESGKVWGAGLDVYEREPTIHEGLLQNDHCVLMPHVGTASFETQRKMEELVIKNLSSAITEGKLLTPVAESKALLMNGLADNGGERTQHVPGNSEALPKASSDIEDKRGINTEGSMEKIRSSATTANVIEEQKGVQTNGIPEKIGSPAMTIIEVNIDGRNPNPTMTNGVNVDGLWERPKTPPKRAHTNWLELSPPLKPKDKYSMMARENSETTGAQAMLDGAGGQYDGPESNNGAGGARS